LLSDLRHIIAIRAQILTTISIVVMLVSLSVSSQGISIYGLIGSLSPLYFMAVALLLMAMYIATSLGKKHNVLLIFQFILFEVYLWGIPAFFYQGLRFPAAAHDLFFYSDIASIEKFGKLNPALYVYQGWPIPYLLDSIVWKILGPVPYLDLSRAAPLLINLFASLLTLNLIKQFFRTHALQTAIFGVVFFQLFNYTEQFTTMAPFAIAFILYYACTFTILPRLIRGGQARPGLPEMILLLLFVATLSATHPVVDIIMISGFVFSFLTRPSLTKSTLMYILFFSVVLVSLWGLFFPSLGFLIPTLKFYLQNHLTVLNSFFGGTASSFVGVSYEHSIVNWTKIALLFGLVLLAAPGLFYNIKLKNIRIVRLLFFVFGTFLAAITIGSLQGGNINAYWLASIIPILILFDLFTVIKLKSRFIKPLILLVLAISVPVSYLVLYGNIATESVPQSTLVVSQFFSAYDNPTPVPGMQTLLLSGLVGYYGSNLKTITPYVYLTPVEPCSCAISLASTFVEIGQSDRLSYLYQWGNDSIITSTYNSLLGNPSFDLVYSSALNRLFYNFGE
jgi:hypothetical protein